MIWIYRCLYFLLIGVTCVILGVWARSMFVTDGMMWIPAHSAGRIYTVQSYIQHGTLGVMFSRQVISNPDDIPLLNSMMPPGFLYFHLPHSSKLVASGSVSFAGFGWEHDRLKRADWTGAGWMLRLPFWAMILVSVAVALLFRRWCRIPLAGHCKRCGYDLRATPDRCPECGIRQKQPV